MNKAGLKFIFTISLSLLVFSACGNNDIEETIAGPGEIMYEANEFSIVYPQDWEVLDDRAFTTLVPHQTVVAFRNNIRNEIFTANVNISRASIETEVSAEDFAKSTMAKVRNALLDVQELPSERHREGVIIEFQARKSPVEPAIRFKSLTVVSNKSAYTITGAYLPTEEETVVNKIDRMLESFSLN